MAAPLLGGETFIYRGKLIGHSGWVTALATSAEAPDLLISCSRDRSLLTWNLKHEEGNFGEMSKRLLGHSHFVSDVAISSDGQFALSGSWDGTLRLWELALGRTTRRFLGHTKDVLSVAFSLDNRHIVSGSRDKTINLWNTLGECKYTIKEDGHSEWVSCVRFSSDQQQPLIVSAGWDKVVKIWNLANCKLRSTLIGHQGYINAIALAPDGSLCASGGQDGMTMLWDIKEDKHLSTLDAGEGKGDQIHALCFSPTKYWLCAAIGGAIKIWDLETKTILDTLIPGAELEVKNKTKAVPHQCISLAWSHDGNTLFAGYTDHMIRAWSVNVA